MKVTHLLAFACILSAVTSAAADDLQKDPDYQACIDRIEKSPEQGRLAALRWISDGGGEPAIYCAAVGDLAMDLPRLAGGRLEFLAEKNRSKDPYLSARLYIQAAQAWSTGKEDERALAAIEAADRMAPEADEVKLLAAPIYAEAGRWGLVKRMLDEVDATGDLNAAALVLRGRAKFELADHEAAAKDLQAALNMDPQNVDGLILRGELAQTGYIIDSYTAQ